MVSRFSVFRRTAVVAAVSVLAVAGVQAATPMAGGQESFAAGSGRAQAKLLKVGPARGSLALAPQVGLALADFINTRGRGDVRAVDLGAIGDFVPPELVGALPVVKVESTDENAETGETVTVGTPPEIPVKLGALELHADAGTEPRSASSATAGAIDIGIGTVSGARAESRTGVVDGATREAVARVLIPRLELAGGAVVLEGLAWTAIQRTGAEQVEQATFTIGAATIAGQSLAAPGGGDLPIAEVVAALEPVLGPLGIEITFPVARVDKGAVDLGPLRLRVSASDAAPALIPVTEGIQPVRDALVGSIRDATEEADVAILLADVALGVITGGSRLDIELGGATAFTAEPAAGFRFGDGTGGFDLGAPVGGAPTLGSGSGSRLGVGAGSAPLPSPPAAGPASTPAAGGAPVGATIDATPASSTDGGAGPLLAVGILGVLAAAGAAVADLRKLRTGRRFIPA